MQIYTLDVNQPAFMCVMCIMCIDIFWPICCTSAIPSPHHIAQVKNILVPSLGCQL